MSPRSLSPEAEFPAIELAGHLRQAKQRIAAAQRAPGLPPLQDRLTAPEQPLGRFLNALEKQLSTTNSSSLSAQEWDNGFRLLYGLAEQIEVEEGASLLSDQAWTLISIAEHACCNASGEAPNEWECEKLYELLFGIGPVNIADWKIYEYLKPQSDLV